MTPTGQDSLLFHQTVYPELGTQEPPCDDVCVGQDPYLGTGVPCALATVGARANKAMKKQLRTFNINTFLYKGKVVSADRVGNNPLERRWEPSPLVVALDGGHTSEVNLRQAHTYQLATMVLLAHSWNDFVPSVTDTSNLGQ